MRWLLEKRKLDFDAKKIRSMAGQPKGQTKEQFCLGSLLNMFLCSKPLMLFQYMAAPLDLEHYMFYQDLE